MKKLKIFLLIGLFASIVLSFQRVETQIGNNISGKKIQLSCLESNKTIFFEDLFSKGGLIALVITDEKACSCALGNTASDLFASHKEKMGFITIIGGHPSDRTENFINLNHESIVGDVFYDTEKSFIKRYKPSAEISIIFLDHKGNTLGILPADLKDKSALRIGHILISQL